MYTQIFSKNELVINAEKGEEEKGRKKEKEKNKQKINGPGKHGEKGKIGVLNYQQIPLPCLRNKTKVRQKKSMKTTNRKVKAER